LLFPGSFNGTAVVGFEMLSSLERVAGLSQVTMRDSKKIKQFVAA